MARGTMTNPSVLEIKMFVCEIEFPLAASVSWRARIFNNRGGGLERITSRRVLLLSGGV